jgi:hypothetical protein
MKELSQNSGVLSISTSFESIMHVLRVMKNIVWYPEYYDTKKEIEDELIEILIKKYPDKILKDDELLKRL